MHLSVPAVTSMLTMLSSFHVQQSWIQCHSMSKYGILVGHMTSLVQGSQLFGWMPCSESSCQFRMLAIVHIQRVDKLWQTQPRPQHRCQQCELVYGTWWPCCAACVTCNSIPLSASSGLHGDRVWTSCNSCVRSTPSPAVRTTYLSSL